MDSARCVVITPYYKEPREVIERCIASVAAQTVPVEHLLVADGFPQDWVDERAFHIALPKPFYDVGNGPRAAGIRAASCASFIAFLDVDNAYDPDHIQTCIATANMNPGCDYVASRRRFVRYDRGNYVPSSAAEEVQGELIDTSCYFFLPQTYHIPLDVAENLAKHHTLWWADEGKDLEALRVELAKKKVTLQEGYMGDRFIYRALQRAGMRPAFTGKQTVTYTVPSEPFSAKHPKP
jgi:glycosyltransferase involved in cell wall biosynthesis